MMQPPAGLPPAPSGTSHTALITTLTNMDEILGKLAQERELPRTTKEQATSAILKTQRRFSHFPNWTKNMRPSVRPSPSLLAPSMKTATQSQFGQNLCIPTWTSSK
jgi:hypothetical protein